MNYILYKQLILQELIASRAGIDTPFADMSVKSVCQTIKENSFFLTQEVVELMEEIAGSRSILKPWKKDHRIVANRNFQTTAKVKSEAMDVLSFALNICIAAGITPDNINEEYTKVWNNNIKRHSNGY